MEDNIEKQPTYEMYLQGTGDILKESQKETEPYKVIVNSREFVVHPNVFSPKYFLDTEAFAQHLPVREGEDMLEIGPGTGAISVDAAYKGAGKVLAIDINPSAVQNTRENIRLHDMDKKIEVRQGDIYSALKEGEKFDTIFWNTPFGLIDENATPSDLERAVYDPGYKSTERFIREAPLHLKEGGRILVGFSTTLGKLDLVKKFAEEAGFDLKLSYEEESNEVYPVKFEIFEGTLKQNESN